MVIAGKEMSAIKVSEREMAVDLPAMPDPFDLGRALLDDALGAYESLIPETDDDDGVPSPVERRAIAKAAFLHLTFEDLQRQSDEEGFTDVKTRLAAAELLAEKYADAWEKVAEIVLRREKGDPEFGLITRLLPLEGSPNLDGAQQALNALRGRFYEPRVAAFFLFDEVERLGPVLKISGRIRSWAVSPSEAGGEARLNTRAFKDAVNDFPSRRSALGRD